MAEEFWVWSEGAERIGRKVYMLDYETLRGNSGSRDDEREMRIEKLLHMELKTIVNRVLSKSQMSF